MPYYDHKNNIAKFEIDDEMHIEGHKSWLNDNMLMKLFDDNAVVVIDEHRIKVKIAFTIQKQKAIRYD